MLKRADKLNNFLFKNNEVYFLSGFILHIYLGSIFNKN